MVFGHGCHRTICIFIGFGDIHDPKTYEFTGFRATSISHTPVSLDVELLGFQIWPASVPNVVDLGDQKGNKRLPKQSKMGGAPRAPSCWMGFDAV